VWKEAERVLGDTAAYPAVTELRALAERVVEAGLFREVVVDLGEVRGFNYYTGPLFHVLAFGPGEPIASGGRYDTLLPRFGLPNTPSAGFAVDINNLCWALEHQGAKLGGAVRVACSADVPATWIRGLRAKGVAVCSAESDVLAFAQAHHFDFVASPVELRRRDGSLVARLPTAVDISGDGWVEQVTQALSSTST
jgi:ATP phosphoribosyltransferase regulatory subunit